MAYKAETSWKTPEMIAFRETLSSKDQLRLNRELDEYAKSLVRAMPLEDSYEELLEELQEGRISPLLFQWAMAVRAEQQS